MTTPTTTSTATLEMTPARPTIASGGPTTHLRVRVSAPPAPVDESRRPVAVALVLDRSGSMGEPAVRSGAPGGVPVGPMDHLPEAGAATSKIAWLRIAAARVIDALPDGDALSIVLFDDRVELAVPLVVLSATTRPALAAAIAQAVPRGSTNIEAGLQAGFGQLGGEVTTAGFARRVIVLSDGLANVGVTNPDSLGSMARRAVETGVTVSTVGFGIDYDADLMRAIAEAGDGDTIHIDEGAEMEGALIEQILDARVLATDASLTILGPAGLRIGTNLNEYAQVTAGAGVRIRLGNLVRARDVLVPMRLVGAVPADPTVIVTATIDHAVPSGPRVQAQADVRLVVVPQHAAETIDLDVLAACVALIAARARRVASGRYEKGHLPAALRALSDGVRALGRLSSSYPEDALRAAGLLDAAAALRDLAGRMQEMTMTLLDAKRTFSMAQSMARSRPVP